MWKLLRYRSNGSASPHPRGHQTVRLLRVMLLCLAAALGLLLVFVLQPSAPSPLLIVAAGLLLLIAGCALVTLHLQVTNEGPRAELAERQRAEAAEALRQQNAYLTGLHETTLGLMNRLDLGDLLQTIVEWAARLLRTQHGYL